MEIWVITVCFGRAKVVNYFYISLKKVFFTYTFWHKK